MQISVYKDKFLQLLNANFWDAIFRQGMRCLSGLRFNIHLHPFHM